MLASVWIYSMQWGWWFAAGFIVLILLHELGHAVVIKAKGLDTGPIMFIPFVGAFISIKSQMTDATVESETAYGGPAAGALAATACFGVFLATGHAFWLHLSYLGFLLNLFNLIPISPLDGGRVVTAISTWLWALGLVVAGALAFSVGSPILILIVILGLFRAIGDWKARRTGAAGKYYLVPGWYRAVMSLAYFGLCGYLGYMTYLTLEIGQSR
jgi:Zn-dependent protease